MYRVTGEVVKVESKPWAMDGRAGVSTRVRVLVGRADFCDVKIADTAGIPIPNVGDFVDYGVSFPPGQFAPVIGVFPGGAVGA